MATSGAVPPARPLLCVAPLDPPGGVDTALAAVGLLAGDRPALVLEVVGGGPLTRALRAHAEYLGVAERVRFRGPAAASAVREAVRGCAVLVLPLRDERPREHGPAEVALVEARELGCPVVATSRAAQDPAPRRSAVVVPPDAPTAMAQAIVTALRESGCCGLPGPPGHPAPPEPAPRRAGPSLRRVWHRVTR